MSLISISTPLYTERLLIRPLTADDACFMFELVNSKGWLAFIGDRGIRSKDDAVNYIATILAKPDFYYYVLQNKHTMESVGILSFMQRAGYDYPDIGFALLPDYYKQGYGHEASQHYLEKIFACAPYQKVMAICDEKNELSARLLTKLGFTCMQKERENGKSLDVYVIGQEGFLRGYSS